jgi:hypothetical protein
MQAVIPGANTSIIKEMVSPAPSCGQWQPSKGRRGGGLAGQALRPWRSRTVIQLEVQVGREANRMLHLA